MVVMEEEEVMLLLEQILNYGHFLLLNSKGILRLEMEVMEVDQESQVHKVKMLLLKCHMGLLSKTVFQMKLLKR